MLPQVSVAPLPPLEILGERWQALEANATGSIFTRWVWMGSWLAATGARPALLAVQDGNGQDIGLALIGQCADRRLLSRLLGAVPTLLLNESGDPLADRVFIEHNGLLVRRGWEGEAHQALAAHLAGRNDWSALRLSGVAPDHALVRAIAAHRRILVDAMPAYGVDLAAVRAAGGDYASLLSANCRQQLRRAARSHVAGETSVQRATSAAEVESVIAAMASLNAGRHADNAWDLPVFRDFCRRLAVQGLGDGSVELLSVAMGGLPVGHLLNLVDGDRVLNYQSAFAPARDGKDKPGLLTHEAAVVHHAGRGMAVYSLLAGRDRYKQSLSTMEERLEWWRLERFSLVQEGEYWLRRLLRR